MRLGTAPFAQLIRDHVVKPPMEHVVLEFVIVKARIVAFAQAALATLMIVSIKRLQIRQLFKQVLAV